MKLMRLRVKFFIKGLIVLVTVLLILPFLVGHLDSQEQRKAEEREQELRRKFNKSYRDKRDDSLIYKEKPIAQPPPLEHKDQNDKDASMNQGHNKKRRTKTIYKNETITSKKYGPRAVLRNGVLGNFEPDDKPVNSNPGDGGKPVFVSMAEKAAADQSVQEFGFNMVASDKVAMDRNIPDTRMEECKYWHYPEELPKASVIIVFHNEGWSTLMRTVHSVINTSPPHLLEEVVMVDDFSNKPHLKGRLDEYIKQFNGKVNLYRNKERLGLIMTRTNGARYAKGDVIVFLDAHCECQKNWLVPLLARIAYDRTIMAVPIIDGIDWNNFRYSPVYAAHSHFRGIFEWGFLYKESSVPGKELVRRGEHSSMPYRSPTHAGGLFAMDRKYFFELGGYDPGLQIWGGENFELSFKIWQCGGSIEWVPCSRVGHVYRNIMPYGFGKISPKIPVVLLNYMRVVEVWLDDEFKEYFYTREPTIRGYDIGDISKQLEFKKKHNCKSFKWFMDNIAYEVYDKFPPPPPNKGWGEIKEKHGSFCWDTMGQHVGGGAIGITNCHHFGGNQLFRLNIKGQLAVGERCINARGSSEITIQYCTVDPTGPWKFKNDGSIYHTELSMCVQSDSKTNKLLLKTCDDMVDKQKWEINQVKTW